MTYELFDHAINLRDMMLEDLGFFSDDELPGEVPLEETIETLLDAGWRREQ